MRRPEFKVPHVFLLLAGVILICALLGYVVPSGQYQRRTATIEGHERTLLVPGTYEHLDKRVTPRSVLLGEDAAEGEAVPVGLHGYLTAIPRGLEKQAGIIFFIFVVGGVFGILQRTGVITAAIGRLLRRFENNAAPLTIALMLALAVGGSTLGMGEEFIPLVPLFLVVSRRLGYDRVYGMALVILAADVGFAASTTNPFTVIVAQGIAEVPLYSGMGLRIVFFFVAIALAMIHLLRYGARIRRDPSLSLAPADDLIDEAPADAERYESHHTPILLACAAIFAFILFATQRYGWWMADMAGGFLLMGVVAALLARLPAEEAVKSFVAGMREMTVAAMVVGFARGIEIVLSDARIMDTIVHGAAGVLQQVPRQLAVLGMLCYESCLNLLIPSGSGQAAVSMPLMAPLSDIIGVSRQTAVFAFTCGDGLSNMVIPTSGILMAMLALARIPYGKWLRFMLPLFGQLMLLAAAFLMLSVFLGYS